MRSCLSSTVRSMSTCRMATGEGVITAAHSNAHYRAARGRNPPRSGNLCVKFLGNQLDIKSHRLIFTKPDDRLFTKRHGNIELSPARRFLFRRFYVCEYIFSNFIPDMEKNVIGTTLTGNKPIPFFFVKVNNFSN